MTKKDENWDEQPQTEDAVLSPAEIAKIKEEARAKILAEKKSNLKTKLMAEETERLKREEGLVTGNGHLDETVNITIDLPTFSRAIVVNGHPYYHGHTYPVPRHVGESLSSQMHMSWKHQNQVDGKSLSEFYAQERVANLYKVGANGRPVVEGKSVSSKGLS